MSNENILMENEDVEFIESEASAQLVAETPEEPRKIRKMSANKVNIAKKVVMYFILILFLLWILVPFYIVIITSFKKWEEANSPNFTWWPTQGFSVDGYKMVFQKPIANAYTAIITGFLNTLWIIIPPTLLGLFTSALAAYAFAKLQFRGKNVLFGILLATMMVPGMVTMVPAFTIYDMIGWRGTPLPLMIPGMFGAAACVFYLRQFFSGIPTETLEAAKLDGLGYVGIFFWIMVPLSKPALIAQGVLGFVGGYNDYFGPLLYLTQPPLQTLQIALTTFVSLYNAQWHAIMAGTVVALLPTVIIYIVAQKYFIEGIASSGLK